MSTSRVRVLTTENVEMIFQAAESDLGSVIHRIQGSQAHPVDENLNPAVPTWWGYGEIPGLLCCACRHRCNGSNTWATLRLFSVSEPTRTQIMSICRVSTISNIGQHQTSRTSFDGGHGLGGSHFVCAGGFHTDEEIPPTCSGLGLVWRTSMTLPREEFLREANLVMTAVWSQPLPQMIERPIMRCVADLVSALNQGWAFNINEADCLFTVFSDIRPIGRQGKVIGVGCQAPDGALIHDGRELVLWRDRRWNSMRGPEHLRTMVVRHPLKMA